MNSSVHIEVFQQICSKNHNKEVDLTHTMNNLTRKKRFTNSIEAKSNFIIYPTHKHANAYIYIYIYTFDC